MSIARFPSNTTEPIIRGAVNLPLPNIRKNKAVLTGPNDDADVCLNCTLPAKECHGGNICYRKHKRIKEGYER